MPLQIDPIPEGPALVTDEGAAFDRYSIWYECPRCPKPFRRLTRDFHFCPMCGVRLEWPKEKE